MCNFLLVGFPKVPFCFPLENFLAVLENRQKKKAGTMRIEKGAGRYRPNFSYCHCQNFAISAPVCPAGLPSSPSLR